MDHGQHGRISNTGQGGLGLAPQTLQDGFPRINGRGRHLSNECLGEVVTRDSRGCGLILVGLGGRGRAGGCWREALVDGVAATVQIREGGHRAGGSARIHVLEVTSDQPLSGLTWDNRRQ